jgi:hypothetical protein
MKKMNFNIDRNIILRLIIYGGIIIIVILVGILPLSLRISKQIKENDHLKYQIREQQELAPVYANVENVLQNKEPLLLPHPEKNALPRAEAGKFQSDFRGLAKKTGLNVVSLKPDINTSASPSASFLHNIVLKGELNGLRKMIIELRALPYLDKIEEIGMQQNTGSMEFTMKVWIALR